LGAYISPFSRKECLKGKLNKPAAAPERLQRLHKNKKKNFNSINLIKQLKNMSCFAGKTLLITGGTGSFGNMVLKRFLESDIKEIRIFSRDEKKQDDMRHHLQSTYSANIASKVKFYIGDVRDRKSVDIVMRSGVDYVFSAAALKQVPSCEFFPMQAVETNVYGTNNVLESAIEYGVKNIVVLSTDKAAYPINSMGISKAMMEKVATAKGRQLGANAGTTICCTRYGNVMASRGSVIPLWVEQMMEGKPITITDPNMTRFMMTLNDAVDLVVYAFEHGENGDLFVQKAPAATLDVLVRALKETYAELDPKYLDTEVKVIGTRHGEKLYETLVTREEMARAIDMGSYYRIPCDGRDLNYDKVEGGNPEIDKMEEYHSHNTARLDVEGMKVLLHKLTFIREDLGLQLRAKAKEIRSE
jgi:UDP-N-acetylglucosamine 4,6-dehydratase